MCCFTAYLLSLASRACWCLRILARLPAGCGRIKYALAGKQACTRALNGLHGPQFQSFSVAIYTEIEGYVSSLFTSLWFCLTG